jgi:hypothetical protein
MKLISMTDFVLCDDVIFKEKRKFKDLVLNYANFLKQPLELWMFVPCDEDGKVLEMPINYEIWLKLHNNDVSSEKGTIGFLIHEEYQQAKERCLFEGFEYVNDLQAVRNQDCQAIIFTSFMSSQCVEDFTQYDLQLTQTAIKQLGL